VRRITIITATAIATLAVAAVAYAGSTSNTYSASFSFNQNGAGTAKKPVPMGFTQIYHAANATAGLRAAPLIDIKLTLPNVKLNWKPFPTCSAAKMLAAKSDTVCPKGAMVASGTITAALGDNTLAGSGTPCTPVLDVWNAGGGVVNYFFVISGTHQCGGLQTGSTAPYPGKFSSAGNGVTEDVPLPTDVSTNAGNIGAYGSLTYENLKWAKLTTKVKGKVVPFLESTGCPGGSKKMTVAFTATDAAGENLTGSTTGSGKC
jgi:hypothetical protein